jgi:hypothetical protein
MAADPLDALRLTLMQDVLPVGLAVADRVRRGGPREVLAAFDGSRADPLGRLREEGEPAASQLRDSLDRFQPGLGNPVLKVEVQDGGTVPPAPATPATVWEAPPEPDASNPAELQATLSRIAARLDQLERRLTSAGSATGL